VSDGDLLLLRSAAIGGRVLGDDGSVGLAIGHGVLGGGGVRGEGFVVVLHVGFGAAISVSGIDAAAAGGLEVGEEWDGKCAGKGGEVEKYLERQFHLPSMIGGRVLGSLTDGHACQLRVIT
jgi:hypothetical protein